ncbi:MAG: hypothetical protein Q9178_007179 [Gyalolechia marmorata]
MAHRPKQNIYPLFRPRRLDPERVKLNVEPTDDEHLERDEPDPGKEDKDDDDLRHKPHGRLPPADFSLAAQPPLELGQYLDTGAAESMVRPEETLGTGTAEMGIQPERYFTD